MPICHEHVFFGEVSVTFFGPFFSGVVFLLRVECFVYSDGIS